MKDWKGNEIKVGDTVLLYEFEGLFAGGDLKVFMILDDSDAPQEIGSIPNPKHSKWELLQTIKVIDPINDGCIHCYLNPDEVPLDSLSWNLCTMPNRCVCIKGLSDNELEHFLHTKNIKQSNSAK